MEKEGKKLRRMILFTSMGLFLFSLTQKSYCTVGSDCSYGIGNFLIGWLGCMFGGAGFSWLANPALIASWILFKKERKLSLIFSIIATIFSLSFLFFDEVVANEAGGYANIISIKSGYCIWLLSCVTMLIGNFIVQKQSKRDNNNWGG